MSKILGLDLGTNSIGWALVEKEEAKFSLVDKGVRIFSEGVKSDKGVESSRAAERTGFRSARKIKFRRKLRKYETLKVLAENDMCPLTVDEVKKWRKSNFKQYPAKPEFIAWLHTNEDKNINPYYFRDKASREKISKYQLGRALYHMAQRRGFLSSRLDKAESELEEYVMKCFVVLDETEKDSDILKTEFKQLFSEFLERLEGKGTKELSQDEKDIKSLYNNLIKILETSYNENLNNSLEWQFKAITKQIKLEGKDADKWVENALEIVTSDNSSEKQKGINEFFDSAKIDRDNFYRKLCNEILSKTNKELLYYVLKQRLMRGMGIVARSTMQLSVEIKAANCLTLGQYFWHLYQQDRNDAKNKIRNNYTSREDHYLHEFELICKTQGLASINNSKKDPSERYSGIVKALYKAIFYQRPLKSQKGLIGKCSFEKSKSRCAVSHPDYEEYRMWTYINTIKIKTPEDKTLRFLKAVERQKLIPKFYRKKDNFSFEDLAKELIPKGTPFESYKSFNAKNVQYLFNYKPKDSVSGCVVSASFKDIFGEDWKTKRFTYQTKNGKGETVNRAVDYKDLWHLLSVAISDIYLQEYAKEKLGLDEKQAKSFSKIKLKKDFASLSLNAIHKILPYLKEGLLYSHAVFMANIKNIVDEKIWNDPKQRIYIQDSIAKIIETNTYENGRLEVINGLIKEYKKEGVYYSKEAETSFKNDLQKKLISFYKYHKIETNQDQILNDLFPVLIEQIIKQKFKKVKRLDEKILEFLSGENKNGEKFCTDVKKLKKLYHPSDIEVFKNKMVKDANGIEQLVLGSPLTSSIKNPMAMRALHQLRKVLNALILEGQIDKKTIIHIEMARELNDANKRKGIQDFQNENKKARETYREAIKELYFEECKKEIEPTEDDLLHYQLWIEQDRKEIYEEGKSISICQIIGNNPEYDIEHTIPRSRSQDNSMMNKTLCSQKFNRAVKKNRMPVELENHEEILLRVDHWRKEAENLTWQIDKIVKSTKTMATKEAKDKKISLRHLLTLKRDYIKGKYDRFIWEEPKVGFKNSQIPDTGIITKYSQNYLKSYFNRVDSVKGGMVAEFRKIWGVQKSYQENGKKYYEIKDRSKHTHHTIDAIIMACMTKDKYDVLASAWTLEDKEQVNDARKLLAESKPWKTFTEDLVKIEEEILVSHYTPDNVKKQSKKIVRVRGKKQYVAEIEKDKNGKTVLKKDAYGKTIYKLDEKGKRIPRLQQGDTIRGSLHQDSIYGAIKNPLKIKKYVIRKDLESIKDIKNIVDKTVYEKVKMAKENGILVIPSNAQQKNKLNGTVWMNEDKGIPINKVRIYANSVKNPLEIKDHAALSKSKHEHKQKVYAQNDENYCMVIYEGIDKKGKLKRAYELVNNIDAGKYYKLSSKEDRNNNIINLIPSKHIETGYSLKYQNSKPFIIKKGIAAILLKNNEEQVEWNNNEWLKSRLYVINGIDKDGIKLNYHQEARMGTDIIKFMNDVINKQKFEKVLLELEKINFPDINSFKTNFTNPEIKKKNFFNNLQKKLNSFYKDNNMLDSKGKLKSIKLKESSLTSPKGGDVIDNYKSFPYVKFRVSGFYAKIENIDFKITPIGKIVQL